MYQSFLQELGREAVAMDEIDPIISPAGRDCAGGAGRDCAGGGSLPSSLVANLFDAISDGFVFLDSELRFQYVNRVAATFIGAAAPTLIGRAPWDVIPALRGSAFEARCLRSLKEGLASQFVDTSIIAEGRWVEYRMFPAGQGLAVYFLDVTAREQAAEALRTSEKRLRLIIDSAPAFICYVDTDYRYRLANHPFETFFGCPEGRIRGRTVREVLGEGPWEMIAPRLARAMAGEVVSYEGEAVYNAGGLRFVHATYTPDKDENGNVRGVIALVRDTTDEKRTQEKLRQSQDQHRRFVESAGVGIVEVDQESGKIVWVNRKYCEMLGYTKEELFETESFKSITHPEDRELNTKALQRLNEGAAKEVQFEKRYIRKDGSCLWVHITVTSVDDPEGGLPRRVAVVKDITARKKVEEDLRRTAEELRQINKAAPVAIWVARDPRCETIIGNSTAHRLFGDLFSRDMSPIPTSGQTEQQDLAVGGGIKVCDGEGRELSISDLPIYRAAANNTEIRDQVLSLHFPDGRQATVVGSAVPLRDDHGAVRGCIAAFVDISARVRAEVALRESEERLRLAVRASGIGHWTWDVESGRCVMDEVCAKILGTKMDTTISEVFSSVEPEDLHVIDTQLHASIADSQPYRAEFRVRCQGSKPRWVVSLGDCERAPDGKIARMYGVNIDITDRKNAEEILKDADRRKDHFLATLAHELRNPLAPISNALHILPRVEQNPSQVAQLREIMHRQVEQLKRLIDDLLDVSRISRGKIELRRERVDLASVIEEAIESIQPFIEAGRHSISVNSPAGSIYVEGDRGRLVQVVGNLIHNAAKYTPPGGRIDLSVSRDELNAAVRVRDNGSGIPGHMLTSIFEPFTQVDCNLDRSQGGLGIGLTLVKTLVEMHAGTIEAKSDGPGRGSEFIVSLPVTSPSLTEDPQAKTPPSALMRDVAEVPRRRILIVDDLKPSADTLGMMLGSLGQDVRICYDGQTALRITAEFNPDMVISDVAMPGMDGYSFVKCVRERTSDLPLLVALTGYGQTYDHRRALEAGFHRHVVKPINVPVLQELLLSARREPADSPACGVNG